MRVRFPPGAHDMPEKKPEVIPDEAEWVKTQMLLFEAGFRNSDKETLQTTYQKILERYGQGVSDIFLFHAYLENMKQRLSRLSDEAE